MWVGPSLYVGKVDRLVSHRTGCNGEGRIVGTLGRRHRDQTRARKGDGKHYCAALTATAGRNCLRAVEVPNAKSNKMISGSAWSEDDIEQVRIPVRARYLACSYLAALPVNTPGRDLFTPRGLVSRHGNALAPRLSLARRRDAAS